MLSCNAGISGVSGDRFLGGNPIDSMYQRLIFPFRNRQSLNPFRRPVQCLLNCMNFPNRRLLHCKKLPLIKKLMCANEIIRMRERRWWHEVLKGSAVTTILGVYLYIFYFSRMSPKVFLCFLSCSTLSFLMKVLFIPLDLVVLKLELFDSTMLLLSP